MVGPELSTTPAGDGTATTLAVLNGASSIRRPTVVAPAAAAATSSTRIAAGTTRARGASPHSSSRRAP
jgi:hypothetical protein